jgi:hypothetical protein
MHCFTLTESGVSRGIKVSRELTNDEERAGIQAGSHFLPFHPEYSKQYLAWAAKWRPEREVVSALGFEEGVFVAADTREKSDYALALVDVQRAEGGRNEITASVKQEFVDSTGVVQRRYRNIGDAVGVRVYFPIIDTGDIDISAVMEAAAGGNAQNLIDEPEKKAREDCMTFLSNWQGPFMLIMLPGSTFRVFRTGRVGDAPKAFSFRWLWHRGWKKPAMKWDVHEPKNYQKQ